MIKILSTCPEKIYLKDISDVIYYKQEKVYSDTQYNSSLDLRREISKGNIIILSKSNDRPSNEVPTISEPQQKIKEIIVTNESDSNKMDILLTKLLELEKKIEGTPKKETDDNKVLDSIIDKIKNIEEKLSRGEIFSNEFIIQAIKNLEEKIAQNSGAQSILNKLESMLQNAETMESRKKEEKITTVLETYVPNIRVEDANSHIKLNTRVIERSDDVSDALDALKKLKENK